MQNKQRRIPYVYYLDSWNFEDGDAGYLKSEGVVVTPSEYDDDIHYGKIFCPNCYTPIGRTPRKKQVTKDGRDPYFLHSRKYQSVECSLKSSKPEGKNYNSYEEVVKSIENEKLAIISEFLSAQPQITDNVDDEYKETIVEDIDGPNVDLPVGRHNGEKIAVPSKISTVKGICRNFDKNMVKYFYLPNSQYPHKLIDLLHDVRKVTSTDSEPKLYFGKVVRVVDHGNPPSSSNIRMTFFEYERRWGLPDFCLKTTIGEQDAHGISETSIGKYVLIYGAVTDNGSGLCFKELSWGEFAILPEKYNPLLDDLH
ncbi:MAG: hypothetical protein MK185_11770 [Saccharospirillaceae bacterium]|nr:hypothetical protein [Saccharospirillaceae bacterium]